VREHAVAPAQAPARKRMETLSKVLEVWGLASPGVPGSCPLGKREIGPQRFGGRTMITCDHGKTF